MTEQIGVATNIANAVNIPVVMDAGAGWGNRCTPCVRYANASATASRACTSRTSCSPKCAHYHTYVAHNIPFNEYIDKIRLACAQRDRTDKAFVIIARSDACRKQGFQEAVKRVNAAAQAGADMGLIFPRTPAEAIKTPEVCKIPMIYVQSRGTRDSRPLYSFKQLEDMGYAGCIDAILAICVHYHYMSRAINELKKTGDYKGMATPSASPRAMASRPLSGSTTTTRSNAPPSRKVTLLRSNGGKG